MVNAVKQPKEEKTDTGALALITDIDTFGQKLKGLKSSEEAYELGGALAARGRKAERTYEAELGKQEVEKTRLLEDQIKGRKEANEAYKKSLRDISPFEPSKENFQTMMTLFPLLSVFAFASGGTGRYSGQAMLASLDGMVRGYRQGRKDLFDREVREFEKNFQAAKAWNEQKRREFDDAITALAQDRELGLQKLKELAMDEQGSIFQAKADAGDVKAMADILAGRTKSLEKADQEKLRLRNVADQRRLMREEKALQDLGAAVRNIASQYPSLDVTSLYGTDAIGRRKIESAYRAMQESEHAAKYFSLNPQAAGAIAVARNLVKMDAIKSIGANQDESNAASIKSQYVDRQLDEAVKKNLISRDDAEAAKVGQKILFALALADVQGSGQRGSVYLDRKFQELYDQASRPETLLKIIRERQSEINNNLKIYGLDVKGHKDYQTLFPLFSMGASDYMKANAPTVTKNEVEIAARKSKITYQEAVKQLKEKGFRVEGEK